MREKKLDGLILTKVENVRYLTSFSGHDSWVLVTAGECAGCRIVERRAAITKALAEQLDRAGKMRRIGVENSVSTAVLGKVRQALRPLKTRIVPIDSPAEKLRRVKEEQEVGEIRRAARIAWECLEVCLKQLRTGMTEQAFAARLEYEMKMRGAKVGFETIAAFGPNGSRNHHQPSARKLRKTDSILIDFGASVNGYTCDITRSFGWGRAGREYQRAWETVYAAQQAAIARVRDGILAAHVDAAARRVIDQSGFPVYGHGTGHGLGLEVHEQPFLSALDRKTRLKEGQVITIEPGIYLPGKFGIRIEDDVLVTKTGAKVLTKDSRYGFSGDTLTIF